MLGASITAGKPTASNCSIKTCGENDTRLDMKGNGQRPTPSILLDSCFELNWLSCWLMTAAKLAPSIYSACLSTGTLRAAGLDVELG